LPLVARTVVVVRSQNLAFKRMAMSEERFVVTSFLMMRLIGMLQSEVFSVLPCVAEASSNVACHRDVLGAGSEGRERRQGQQRQQSGREG
jgi:hypothetical protein